MKRPLSPAAHALIDYTVVLLLLVWPKVFRFNREVCKVYLAEAMLLLPYISLTRQPFAVWGVIPFKTHGTIDIVNIAQFAAQTAAKSFSKQPKALFFNVAFTLVAGLTVLFTDFNRRD